MPKLVAESTFGDKVIRVLQGDITEQATDAIVNAANNYLKHGGGVAAAIVRRVGDVIQKESDKIGYVPTGSAAITTGGALKAKWVIHAVGPRMGEGDEDEKLRRAVRSALELASQRGLRSITLPAISSGIYGFPKDRCAKILVGTAREFIKQHPESSLESIEFCLFDDETAGLFKGELDALGY